MKKLILLTLFFCGLKSSYAQPGELDPSFGNNGSVTTNFDSLPGLTKYKSIAIQTDGKLVASGFTTDGTNYSLALARYNIDGSLDKSFSGDGKVTADSFISVSMAIQEDGKILVAGSALTRYNIDGSIDSTFSNDGKITADFNFSSVAVQKDGKIVVAGPIGDPATSSQDFALERFNPDGSPDNTFSDDGKLQTDIFYVNDIVASIAIQSDGKIIAAGVSSEPTRGSQFYITLLRYNVDGSLDSNFNGNGIATYDYFEESPDVSSLTLQNDGKILIVQATISGNVAIGRFNNNGSVDESFGNYGLVQTPLFHNSESAILVQNDGKILLAGSIGNYFDGDFGIVRYNTNGNVDSSFNEDGIQVIKITSDFDFITSLVISNNNLYAAGSAGGKLAGAGTAAVAAYMQTGELDLSFGANGIVKTNFGNRGSTMYTGLSTQTDGKLIAVGSTYDGTIEDFAVARYNTDGSLDNTFSADGKQTTNFGISQSAIAASVAIQSDGKIVVVGRTGGSNADENFAIARYNPDGSPDNTFDEDGKLTTNFGDEFVEANSVAIQNDGKIVVAGTTGTGTTFAHFAVVRYNSDGSLDNTFDGDGKQTTGVLNSNSRGNSVAIQSDQKIIVGGYAGAPNYFALVRYNNDGSLDKSFSNDGMQQTSFGVNHFGSSIAIQANGKIVFGGYSSADFFSPVTFSLARYNTDGDLDSSFSEDGKQTENRLARLYSLAIQNNGKILAAGTGIARFNIDGRLDSTFSKDGIQTTNVRVQIAISNNKLYTVGFTPNLLGTVSRYLLEDETLIPPTISLTTPANNATYLSGANVYLNAAASDADGTISKVEFYNGSTLLYTATDTPYTFKWQHVAKGNYTLTAKATDNDGLVTTSAEVHISVVPNTAPSVSIINPANNRVYLRPANIYIEAVAQDPDGRVTKVEFYNGTTLLKTDFQLPYTLAWTNVPLGNYVITAKATDNWGAKTISAPVNVSVVPNKPPSVSIISPGNGETFNAPATIFIEAAAQDPDGRVTKVEFYNGATLLKTDFQLPYTLSWANVPAGDYVITAKATDNWGAKTTSAPITVTVAAPGIAMMNKPSSANIKTDMNSVVSLKLAPNPAKSILNIYTTGLQTNKQTTVSVISSSGVVVQAKQLKGSTQTIQLDVASFVSGVYVVKILSGDKVIYKQFVKL